MASQCYFPEDLMVLIMSKLPVKSLVRFKIISKDFTARTTTKSFISQHLAHSTLVANNKPTFLVIHFRDTFCMTLISDHHLLDHDDDDDHHQQQAPIIVELNPEFPFAEDLLDTIIAHGPSNGIFCLEVSVLGHPDRLILWNPATTKIKILPLPLAPEYFSNWDYFSMVHGFGVDYETNDYKVVHIMMGQKFDDLENNQSYAQVYSVNADSWNMVDINVPNVNSIMNSVFSSFLNGVYHWLTQLSHGVESILSFDMRNDEFWQMGLPTLIGGAAANGGGEHLVDTNVAVINDLLGYVKEYRSAMLGTRVEIWVMSEYGDEGSWTRRFNIGPSPGIWKFWGFWKEDEVVLIGGDEGQPLALYDIGTQLRVRECPANIGMQFHAFRYVESIAPLNPLGEEEEG